ncbi:uncharacterized protein TrAtP1_013014 [Trichoderma atroviride]|uniref:uncharacterized protein n=1 Tax=Hypocrea atroviridis TaxID=63577 RepID=UPI0033318E65|nr:hypothetical protein TrAtP1_013014 [Trichoderma atroviride]
MGWALSLAAWQAGDKSPVMLNHRWMPNHLLLPQGLSDEQTGSVTFVLITFCVSDLNPSRASPATPDEWPP